MTTTTQTQNGTTNSAPAPRQAAPLMKRDQGFEPETLNEAIALSERLAVSALLPDPLKNKPADVLIILLQGRELGLSPIRSLNDIYVVKGKPMCSADTMKALCLQHPDICEYVYTVESSGKSVTVETKRRGSPKAERETYTIEQATAAGLLSNDTYKKYPHVMLEHRATATLMRRVYPDLIRGFYIDEESDEIGRVEVRGGSGTFTAPEPKPVDGKRVDPPPPTPQAAAASAPAPQPAPAAVPAPQAPPGEPTADDKRLVEAKELIESVQASDGFTAIGDRISALMEGASEEVKAAVKAAWGAKREALKKAGV